jgi:methylated-DNA-[protein]-cysteine S-methyltransferase
MNARFIWHLESPIGKLTLWSDGAALTGLAFPGEKRVEKPAPGLKESPEPFAEAIRQLGEYFAGQRRAFDLSLAPEGTAFQRRVWDELTGIPFGATISYAELARRIGNPKAVRAVGGANGRNPLPIIVPCHRVIGADGRLTGFGGGLPIKERLLAFERTGRWEDASLFHSTHRNML